MLTKRQKQILDFIKQYRDKREYAPSLEEIKKRFRFASVSTVHFHIKKLQELGQLKKEQNKPRSIEVYQKEQLVKISLLGTIAAGQPIEAIPEKEVIAMPKSRLPRTGDFYALRVLGKSMIEENINDGDVVIVKNQSVANNGQRVVALIDNYEVTLKKIYKEKNRIRLQPANPTVEPIFVNPENLIIQGVVIDIIKNISRALHVRGVSKKKNIIKHSDIKKCLNQVIEDDCLNAMQYIPNKSIDMILCDLPYGTTQNKWDSIIPLDQLWEHYERIIKDNGVIALNSQGLFTANLIASNPKFFKYKIVWIKSKSTNFLNAKKQPLRKHEDICIFYKKQPIYNPQMAPGLPYNKGIRKNQLTGSYGDFHSVEVKSDGKRYPNDIVYFKTAESEGRVYHPTQKPIALGRYLIRTFTRPHDVVLDNTCGSGSFLVAAVLEKRQFIGIEKNQEVYLHKKKKIDYINVCKARIKKAREELKMNNRLFEI